jgi:acyl-CoA thioesterase I
MMNTLSIEQIVHTIQFHHPEKSLAQKMPGINEPKVLAALLGIPGELYCQICADFRLKTREAAEQLLAEPGFAALVDRLPFAPHSRVVGWGDSITDDRLSWLEILRQLLELWRPADGIQIINAGFSGDTTTHLISRFHYVSQVNPDWIICLAGTNDVRRHGRSPNQVLVSGSETAKNLQVLRQLAATQTRSRWVWLTPPLVVEQVIDEDLVPVPARWLNQDLQAVAAIIHQQLDLVIDLQEVFGVPVDPSYLLADGLHPSLLGQQSIVRAVVKNLTTQL